MPLFQRSISELSRCTRSKRMMCLIDFIGRHPEEICKEYLKECLTELKTEEHYIYVLLDTLPLEAFCISRYQEHNSESDSLDFKETPDAYSVKDFYRNYNRFHDKDFFFIRFGRDHFYFELELSVMLLIPFYECFLATRCEREMRNNKPILLTPELRKQYGLTTYDTGFVSRYLEQFNKDAANKIQLEYDAVKGLDCIKK